jgi:amidophosphoribosyltransferase
VILNVFANALSQSGRDGFRLDAYHAAVDAVYRSVRGAYSVVGFIAGYGLFAFRDPFGIKPIAIGSKKVEGRQAWAVASESVVLTALGYDIVPLGSPGEAVFINMEGELHRHRVADPQPHPCVFEYVYFARPDSYLEGVSVYEARMKMGEKLADAFRAGGHTADVVIPVPDSARTSALSMAQALGLPYREGLVMNRYVGRTFIMPDAGERKRSVRRKLNAIEREFTGRDVLLVDDSIVRGTTSRQIVQLARQAGANRVLFASTSPPLTHPCVYGIDMATKREFIARDRTSDEIADSIGADEVIYQSLDDLLNAVREGNGDHIREMCSACFTGDYPTGDITEAMLVQIEEERLIQGK